MRVGEADKAEKGQHMLVLEYLYGVSGPDKGRY